MRGALPVPRQHLWVLQGQGASSRSPLPRGTPQSHGSERGPLGTAAGGTPLWCPAVRDGVPAVGRTPMRGGQGAGRVVPRVGCGVRQGPCAVGCALWGARCVPWGAAGIAAVGRTLWGTAGLCRWQRGWGLRGVGCGVRGAGCGVWAVGCSAGLCGAVPGPRAPAALPQWKNPAGGQGVPRLRGMEGRDFCFPFSAQAQMSRFSHPGGG